MCRDGYNLRTLVVGIKILNRGECLRLRYRIDTARANQKPLLHIARTNHLAVFDIANKLYTLDAILEYSLF